MQRIHQYLYMRMLKSRGTMEGKKYNPREAVRLPASQAALHHILVSPTVFAPALQNYALAYCRSKTK